MMARILAAGLLALMFAPASAKAQVNRCAECHFANFSAVPGARQLAQWDRSPHAKHGVGCDSCHGGDPTTYQPVDAHRGVLNPSHPLSRVYRGNLVLTCAACHQGVAAAFESSAHAALPPSGGRPSCTTCHGAMAAQVPSAAALERACAGCHQANPTRADYPGLARERVEAVNRIERTLARLETSIASIDDRQKRNRLAAELLLARAALRNAVDAFHTFDFRVMDEQRAVAQRRAADLVTALIASN